MLKGTRNPRTAVKERRGAGHESFNQPRVFAANLGWFRGLCAILAGALGRQAAGLGDGGAKPAQTPTTVGATRTVAGRVVDSQGNPVAGAQVWWYVRDEPGSVSEGARTAAADSD
jgi:hypothetical protein